MRRLLSIALALFVCVSCAKGTPTNPILPPGVSPTKLPVPANVGIGRYQKLAEITQPPSSAGVPFVSFLQVPQVQGSSFQHGDVGGFVYSSQGTHVLSRDDGERVKDVSVGMAGLGDAGPEHPNPGT